MKISKAVGIDLGIRNSVVAMTNLTDTEIICYEKYDDKTIPSVVASDEEEGIIVGTSAFSRRGTQPEPILSIKTRVWRHNFPIPYSTRFVALSHKFVVLNN